MSENSKQEGEQLAIAIYIQSLNDVAGPATKC